MTPLAAVRFLQRRTISRDLSIGLALITAVVISFFTAAYQRYTTHHEIHRLEIEAAAIADDVAEVLARPLWNMDMDTVRQIVNAYLSADFVTGVRIVNGPEVLMDTIPDQPDDQHWQLLKRNIVNDGETIGAVTLHFSNARVRAVGKNALMQTLVTIFLVTAAIGLGSHLLMKRLVERPLNRLIAGIRTIGAGDYQLTLPDAGRVEINTLTHEINHMAREIDRREADVRKLRETLQNIIDSMPSVLVGVDPGGRVTQWNREAETTTGVHADDAVGRAIGAVYPSMAEVMPKVRRAIDEKTPLKESKVVDRSGETVRYCDITVYPLMTSGNGGAVIRVDDITERVRIEEMMIQSEKMLSVGGLAAGMAHEINNPLAGILQNAQVMRNRLYGDLPKNREVADGCGIRMEAIQAYMAQRNIPEMLDSIMTSGQRAAKIVENMLSFSRKSETMHSLHDAVRLLEATLELAGNDYDLKKGFDFRRIKIVREYDPGFPRIPCEAGKMQQVFLNILKNGAQAMAGNPGDRPPQFILRAYADGETACLEIEDNGPGMPEAVRKRIFEPFFTTKPVGIGTGLGLSVSYFIITENHGGTLYALATQGGGTRFVIRLPIDGDASAGPPSFPT